MEHRVEHVLEQQKCTNGSQVKAKYRQHIKKTNISPQYRDGDGQTVQKLSKEYSEMKKKIAHYIQPSEDLSTALDQESIGWQGGYTSGTKVDLKKMLQALAIKEKLISGNADEKLDRRSAAATLLIDLSGSMQGENQ